MGTMIQALKHSAVLLKVTVSRLEPRTSVSMRCAYRRGGDSWRPRSRHQGAWTTVGRYLQTGVYPKISKQQKGRTKFPYLCYPRRRKRLRA